MAYHRDLLWITNDKTLVPRDSDSVGLGWDLGICVAKRLLGDSYSQPGFLHTTWPGGSEALLRPTEVPKGGVKGAPWAGGWNAVSIPKSHKAKVKIRPWLSRFPQVHQWIIWARRCVTPTKQSWRGSWFLPLTVGILQPALSLPTAGSPWEPIELNFQLTELAHSPAGENSSIINIQNLSWEWEEELQLLA